MTGSACNAMDVCGVVREPSYRVGVRGREDSRMTGSAYNAMDVSDSCESLLKGRGLGKGGQSGLHWIGGWRMTGSAYNLLLCESLC